MDEKIAQKNRDNKQFKTILYEPNLIQRVKQYYQQNPVLD